MKIAPRLHQLLVAALLALAFLPAAAAPKVEAAPDGLAVGDRQCLGCHGEKGLEKKFADGQSVALHVDAPAFAKSVHAAIGCAACHADIDIAKHPAQAKSAVTARAFSVALSQACRNCHEASFDAHAKGVHGKAQEKAGELPAPTCSSCHGTHDIVRASLGTALRDVCLGCHADAVDAHAKWLPNTRMHLDVVSCAACHAPAAGKRIELRFYDKAAKQELVTDGQAFTRPATDGKSNRPLDATQVRDLVRAIDRGGAAGNVVLVGRVEPVTAADGHQLLPKAQALKDCATCHRKGAEPFQQVSLSVVGTDGERVRYDTEKDVLHGPASLESVRGFYAMGGTRIPLLDILLGLALFGGISAPLGHLLMRKLSRKKEERHE